jgi:hypothetical protein
MSNEQAKSLSIYVFKVLAYLSLSVCGVLIADSYKSVKEDVKEIKQKVETINDRVTRMEVKDEFRK